MVVSKAIYYKDNKYIIKQINAFKKNILFVTVSR